MLLRFILLLGNSLLLGVLTAQVTLQIGQLPINTPVPSTLYAAGTFNDWAEGDSAYTFRPNSEGTLELTLTDLSPGTYDYKITRGSWSTVEGNANGGYRPNRSFTYAGSPATVVVDILSWEDLGGTNSTAASNVQILATHFWMPQLGRERRIWVYLPPDYANNERSYPVLYMHDGQNLFDAATSFAGEWEVDETLNSLFAAGDPGIIVVGIDNGGGSRLDEYTPWPNPTYGGGEGGAYVDFLVETLKPYIDANYRTLPEAASTGIMGSSLGGLISLYAALKYPDVFGRAGVLSPSLWFSEDIYHYADTVAQSNGLRLYFLGGGAESASVDVIGDINRFVDQLEAIGYPATVQRAFHPEGQHAEWYWAREFGAAYQWLFSDLTHLGRPAGLPQLQAFPNPVTDTLFLGLGTGEDADPEWEVQVYDNKGIRQSGVRWSRGILEVSHLPAGTYFALVKQGPRQWSRLSFVKL